MRMYVHLVKATQSAASHHSSVSKLALVIHELEQSSGHSQITAPPGLPRHSGYWWPSPPPLPVQQHHVVRRPPTPPPPPLRHQSVHIPEESNVCSEAYKEVPAKPEADLDLNVAAVETHVAVMTEKE